MGEKARVDGLCDREGIMGVCWELDYGEDEEHEERK